MSRTLDLIIKAEQKRNNKHTLALLKQDAAVQPQEAMEKDTTQSRRRIIEVLFFCILLLSFTFNFKLFVLVKDKDAHIVTSQKTLGSFQESLERLGQEMRAVSEELHTIGSGVEAYGVKINHLEKESQTQRIALGRLEGLTSGLSGSVHTLGKELESVKNGGQQ